jgi:hypothetical protein
MKYKRKKPKGGMSMPKTKLRRKAEIEAEHIKWDAILWARHKRDLEREGVEEIYQNPIQYAKDLAEIERIEEAYPEYTDPQMSDVDVGIELGRLSTLKWCLGNADLFGMDT